MWREGCGSGFSRDKQWLGDPVDAFVGPVSSRDAASGGLKFHLSDSGRGDAVESHRSPHRQGLTGRGGLFPSSTRSAHARLGS